MTASETYLSIGSRPALARYSPLAAVSAAALSVVALGYLYVVLVIIGEFNPMLVVTPIAWLTVLLPLTGKRWASIPAVVVATAGLAFELPLILGWHINEHEFAQSFVLSVVVFPVSYAVAIAAGIGATVQNYRRAPAARTMPAWARVALIATVGLVAGGSAVAFAPKYGAVARVSTEAVESLPVSIAMGNDAFVQQEMRVKAGETVQWRVLNADGYDHTFDLDEFGIHATLRGGESGFVMFKPEKPGRYVYDCAIPGHNMSGVLIVE